MGELARRRSETAKQIRRIQGHLKEARALVRGKACVFATGSFGRGEASAHSDLDVFIVGRKNGKPGTAGVEGSLLGRLDEICVKANLIKATRQLKIKEFSGDGQYLAHYSVHEFTKTLGTPEDDVTNTFTARVLLLLESRPLLEPAVYRLVTKEVIDAYWRDYEDHSDRFVPAFLANDILRLWRTFCVNYEARTERVPPLKKAKGTLKNYKLKHSRLLTCYSALLHLLAVYGQKRTVTPADAMEMIGLSPTQRLESLLKRRDIANSHREVTQLLREYETFLQTTNADEDDLIKRFMSKATRRSYMDSAYKFGDLVFKVLATIGKGNRFHRLLVV